MSGKEGGLPKFTSNKAFRTRKSGVKIWHYVMIKWSISQRNCNNP